MLGKLRAAAIYAVLALNASQVVAQKPEPQIWFSPAPGSIDFQDLFITQDKWSEAKDKTDVFQFYDLHTFDQPLAEVGPNNYNALRLAGAFTNLPFEVALEAGYVKEHNCRNFAKLENSIVDIIRSMDKVRQAGKDVNYLVLQEPYTAATSGCGWDNNQMASIMQVLDKEVRKKYPSTQIGLVEAFPTISSSDYNSILRALKNKNSLPNFIHLDIDLKQTRAKSLNMPNELQALSSAFKQYNIPWGVVMWGENATSPVIYQDEVMDLVAEVENGIKSLSYKPDRFIVQSWAGDNGKIRMNPPNLPETKEYTHTFILNKVSEMFVKQR